jgi:hypothetical protein
MADRRIAGCLSRSESLSLAIVVGLDLGLADRDTALMELLCDVSDLNLLGGMPHRISERVLLVDLPLLSPAADGTLSGQVAGQRAEAGHSAEAGLLFARQRLEFSS